MMVLIILRLFKLKVDDQKDTLLIYSGGLRIITFLYLFVLNSQIFQKVLKTFLYL